MSSFFSVLCLFFLFLFLFLAQSPNISAASVLFLSVRLSCGGFKDGVFVVALKNGSKTVVVHPPSPTPLLLIVLMLLLLMSFPPRGLDTLHQSVVHSFIHSFWTPPSLNTTPTTTHARTHVHCTCLLGNSERKVKCEFIHPLKNCLMLCLRVAEGKFKYIYPNLNPKYPIYFKPLENLIQDVPEISGTRCVFVLLELCWRTVCGPGPPALPSLCCC